MIGVTFDHHFYNAKAIEQAANNVCTAVDYIRTYADTFQLDPDRLCLLAFSGGGPLLSFALRDQPDYIRCIAAFYAMLDLQASKSHKRVIRKTFSPAAYLTNNNIPILVARAGKDRANINRSIESFINMAANTNVPVKLLEHAGGRHGFDILDDDDRSRQIVAETITFIMDALSFPSEP